jgi:hypothetical protein
VVEATTNLIQTAWSPLSTNSLVVGTSYFSSPQWAKYQRRGLADAT